MPRVRRWVFGSFVVEPTVGSEMLLAYVVRLANRGGG